MNPYLYNPAYVGIEGHSVIFLQYQQRWTIEDAPKLMHATFHTPLKGGIGLGFTAYNSTQGGLLNKSAGKVSASYLVTLDKKHHLRFGMSVGGGNQTLNFGELDDPTDPAFMNIIDQSSFIIADFGATYHFDHFNFGISIPSLISYDLFQSESLAPVRVKPLDNLLLKINYRGHINDDIAIEPHVIYRYSHYTQSQYEGTIIFHIYHLLWLGGSYRQEHSGALNIGVKLMEKLAIGYAYELGNPVTASLLGPTHEVHIGLHLGSRKSHATHSSSFIKSHRLTADERAEKAELEREKKLKALQDVRTRAATDEDELSIVSQKPVTPSVDTSKTSIKTVNDWEIDDEFGVVERNNDFGEKEDALVIKHYNEKGEEQFAITWVSPDENLTINHDEVPLKRTSFDGNSEIGVNYIRINENGEKEQVIKWEPVLTAEQVKAILSGTNELAALSTAETEEQIPDVTDLSEQPKQGDQTLTEGDRTHEELGNSDEHLEVKRGNNMLELPAGFYVIAGAFETFEHAETFSEELFNKGYHDANAGYSTARGYFYVFTFRTSTREQADRERDRERKKPGMSKVWVLKVND